MSFLCHICDKPAICFGAYDGDKPGYACGDCCAHGNEDGWCNEIPKWADSCPDLLKLWCVIQAQTGKALVPHDVQAKIWPDRKTMDRLFCVETKHGPKLKQTNKRHPSFVTLLRRVDLIKAIDQAAYSRALPD